MVSLDESLDFTDKASAYENIQWLIDEGGHRALFAEEMLYLEEYDAFYNFTSDYGPGFFTCAGGQITGDTVLLWSEPDFNGSRCELTLRKSGENWLIQSHHTIYER